MSVAYFDCFSGVAGDMILGALVDAGLPLNYLKKELKKLNIGGYKIRTSPGKGQTIAGTNLKVEVLKEASLSRYLEIRGLIQKSRLSKEVKRLSTGIFANLAGAEAKVHGKSVRGVHFHEIGGVDSIVDIVGTAIGIKYLGFKKIYSSPISVSRGYVKCAHGTLPLPAPAALELIRGVPVETIPVKGEIATPTGVAIIKTLADGFGSSPLRRVDKIGYGFGDNRFPGMPNAVRLMIGEGHPLMVVEANVDDMNPEFYPDVIEKVLGRGAIDAGVIPMVMKRGRPGSLIHILCEERDRRKIINTIITETTTFGVRYFPVDREIAEREVRRVKTGWGTVKVKIARYKGKTTTISPEHKDCKVVASRKNIPIKDVYRKAILNTES